MPEIVIGPTTIERIAARGDAPLSFNQDLQLLTDWRMFTRTGNIVALHPSIAYRFHDEPDEGALEAAMNALLRRHEVLRSSFPNPASVNGTEVYRRLGARDIVASSLFRQTIHGRARVELALRSALSAGADQEAGVADLLQQESRVAFCYDRPPLIRATMIKADRQDYILLIVLHHLVSDRWSLAILRRELSILYKSAVKREAQPPLIELPIQYSDFAAWQRRQVLSGAFDGMIQYWCKQWDRYMPEQLRGSDLPFSRPVPVLPTFVSDSVTLSVDSALTAQVRRFARASRVTPFTFWLAAIALVFHVYSGKTKISLFSDLANRLRPETEHLIGWVATSVLLGITLEPDSPVTSALMSAKEAALGAQSAQAVPLGGLLAYVDEARLRDLDTCEWVSYDFVSTAEGKSVQADALGDAPTGVSVTRSRATLCLSVREQEENITLGCIYSVDRFQREDILKMLNRLKAIAAEMLAAPHEPVSRVANAR